MELTWPALRAGATGAMLAAVVLVAACGSSSEPEAAPSQPDAPTSSDSAIAGSFTANGHQLYLECTGDGAPTMVLEVGEGRTRGDLVKIQDAYEGSMRVCTYDRANKGESGQAAKPRKGADIAADLHDLLRVAHVPGPYLLVGHSAGGLIVEAYAARFPDEVSGVVAINPVAPWRPWVPVMARMTADERRSEVDFLTGHNGEFLDYRDIGRAVEGRLPTRIPASVLVSSPVECPPTDASCPKTITAYDKVMRQFAHRWGNASFQVVDASHDIQFDDLGVVTAAIDDVISRSQQP